MTKQAFYRDPHDSAKIVQISVDVCLFHFLFLRMFCSVSQIMLRFCRFLLLFLDGCALSQCAWKLTPILFSLLLNRFVLGFVLHWGSVRFAWKAVCLNGLKKMISLGRSFWDYLGCHLLNTF